MPTREPEGGEFQNRRAATGRSDDRAMLERVTAFLAQAAAAVLAVTVLIGVLSYSHGAFYRKGYCSAILDPYDPYCDGAGPFASLWPFGDSQASGRRVSGPGDYDRRPDPPPNVAGRRPGASAPTGSSGPSTQPGQRPGLRPGSSPGGASSGPLIGSGGADYGDTPLSVGDGPTGLSPGARPGATSGARSGVGLPGAGRTGRSWFGRDLGGQICEITRRPGDPGPPVSESDLARCWLHVGDAYFAVDNTDEAQDHWRQALEIGADAGGAQASLTAHRRLQSAVLERSCPTSLASLARIAYGYETTREDGEVIDLWMRQRALSALGFYPGDVDGAYGPVTRRAVRDFQEDMGFDRTGALTAQETVTLICHAALTARDSASQNHLGVMFATGLGVRQNIDTSLEWLEEAASRGHAGANFNLALIYGTGTVQGSWRLCGVVESPERADSYLRRAAELGHAQAASLRRRFPAGGQAGRRWQRISEHLAVRAVDVDDRFYLAWRRRLEEARLDNVARQYDENAFQAGCFFETEAALDVEGAQDVLEAVSPEDDYVVLREDYAPDEGFQRETGLVPYDTDEEETPR